MTEYYSWGRTFKPSQQITRPVWRFENLPTVCSGKGMIPYGLGRSYGDVCLNDEGMLLSTEYLGHYIRFDQDCGILSCEAGVSLAQILELAVAKGWFLPVTPGTKYVTIGGAIANDVHGKNHHVAGTFGNHVIRFELLRSDGTRLVCDRENNSEYFHATIGGLGLTGMITWVEIQLKPIDSTRIDVQAIKFASLEEFIHLSGESDTDWEYTVAWLDCMAKGKRLGRGIFYRGNHLRGNKVLQQKNTAPLFAVPLDMPSILLNTFTIKAFNSLYYNKQRQKQKNTIEHYNGFFYPLDGIGQWNRLYGKQGFYQFQCVIPDENQTAMQELLKIISASGQGSFLSVLKRFGSVESPGMLSFPRTGLTLALDFANRGTVTVELLRQLESVVVEARGAIYPAKDALMDSRSFAQFYPQLENFRNYVDPGFSSSFWRRINTGEPA